MIGRWIDESIDRSMDKSIDELVCKIMMKRLTGSTCEFKGWAEG